MNKKVRALKSNRHRCSSTGSRFILCLQRKGAGYLFSSLAHGAWAIPYNFGW